MLASQYLISMREQQWLYPRSQGEEIRGTELAEFQDTSFRRCKGNLGNYRRNIAAVRVNR
jgi:hypothetical protein